MNVEKKKEKAGEYYTISERWLSDLAFAENEISFFDELLKKDLILSPDVKTDDALHELKILLATLRSEMGELVEDVHGSMRILKQTMLKSDTPDLRAVRTGHSNLNKKVNGIVLKLKKFKSDLFRISKGSYGTISPEALLTI